ncbi:MAG: HAMP domain-containing histidine kinase [Akkermansiaceae bacterium]|nr:HAMP domain-containing histidine kinase [Akkermansiaceae bacterium]
MKASRSFLVWSVLALCGLMVLGAMSWLTRGVLASEKTRVEAESRADLEERTRLALWRMDAAGAAIVSEENRRSSADFGASADTSQIKESSLIKLRFTFTEGGRLSAPEITDHKKRLTELRLLLSQNELAGSEWSILTGAVDASEASWSNTLKDAKLEATSNINLRQSNRLSSNRADENYQSNFNEVERSQRAKTVEKTISKMDLSSLKKQVEAKPQPAKMAAAKPEANFAMEEISSQSISDPINELGTMRPVWIGENLFLLRQLSSSAAGKTIKSVQGLWLDHDVLKKQLLAEISDLFPNAILTISKNPATDPLALVSFPFHFTLNESAPIVQPTLSAPLLIGWVAVLIALLTAAALIYGLMSLSERRASFVSAVTHELRTPLTTFRLYSDMLESGAVKPEKRSDYLRVLSREADRLAHLVENVLSFSKIERGSARSQVREMSISDLLRPMHERLESRLATADLKLKMDLPSELATRVVRLDSAAVEHILFNLIDNAAKYATASDPPEVEIHTKAERNFLEISVVDHGPGIPASERRRIFRAFHKSALEAAESRPGVGLGLALSRRLAKSLGGTLDCVDSAKGACFLLRLPLPHKP